MPTTRVTITDEVTIDDVAWLRDACFAAMHALTLAHGWTETDSTEFPGNIEYRTGRDLPCLVRIVLGRRLPGGAGALIVATSGDSGALAQFVAELGQSLSSRHHSWATS